MVENIFEIRDILQEKQQANQTIDFKLLIDPEGHHTESRWHEEFPRAIAWLFYGR
jgi:hypothetical protein